MHAEIIAIESGIENRNKLTFAQNKPPLDEYKKQ